jgi:hypothetical protein
VLQDLTVMLQAARQKEDLALKGHRRMS